MIRTFNVILSVRLFGLVVVYHLNHLKEIVFLELREGFGEFLHVDVLAGLLALLLGLCGCCSVGLAGWAGLLQDLEKLTLGVAESLEEMLAHSWGGLWTIHTTVCVLSYRSCWKLRSWESGVSPPFGLPKGDRVIVMSNSPHPFSLIVKGACLIAIHHVSVRHHFDSVSHSFLHKLFPHNVLCFALLPKLSWSWYIAFSKQSACTSSPSGPTSQMLMLHPRMGKPSTSGGSSLEDVG